MGTMTNLAFYHWVVLAIAAGLLIAAAVIDARHFRIPNALTAALLLLFPVYAFFSPTPIAWDEHLGIFFLVLIGGFALYSKKFAGAGDIKLLTVMSLWAGSRWVLMFLFITTVAGGLLGLAVAVVAYYRHRKQKSDKTLALGKVPIPYGVAIAIGGLCTLVMLSHKVQLSI